MQENQIAEVAESIVYVAHSHGHMDRLLEWAISSHTTSVALPNELFRGGDLETKIVCTYLKLAGHEYLYHLFGVSGCVIMCVCVVCVCVCVYVCGCVCRDV